MISLHAEFTVVEPSLTESLWFFLLPQLRGLGLMREPIHMGTWLHSVHGPGLVGLGNIQAHIDFYTIGASPSLAQSAWPGLACLGKVKPKSGQMMFYKKKCFY